MIREDFLTSKANRPGITMNAIHGVVVHWTANTSRGATADANRRYFNRPFRELSGKLYEVGSNNRFRYGSTHYIIDEKEVVYCIPENEVAYHVGDGTPLIKLPMHPNYCLLGIEMCVNGDFVKTLRRTIWMLEDILIRNPQALVYRHYDITGKACPHMYLPSVVGGVKHDWSWHTFLELLRSRNASFTKNFYNYGQE